jgi:hypothetical protein
MLVKSHCPGPDDATGVLALVTVADASSVSLAVHSPI